MNTLDRSAIEQLAGHEEWPAVSVYLPAHRAGNESTQDPIRLKNLLRHAEEELVAGGMRSPDAAGLLSSASALLADPGFWREGFDGLAIFVSTTETLIFRTSRPLPERVRVASRHLVRPLITALAPDLRFMVLALSKNRVRILEGTPETVKELEPEGIPQGLAEALKYDDYEKHVQFHSRTPASGRGRRAAIFHGHGGSADAAKVDLLRYFRQVDRGLKELLGGRDTPMLLAGVEYLLPIYEEASTYPHLLEERLTGNPDEVPAAAIHAEALSLLAPHVQGAVEESIRLFAERREGAGASDDLSDIVPAAAGGRVDTLLVAEGEGAWGAYDPDTGSVELAEGPGNGAIDLLDRAAAETLLHGGTVHVLPAEGIREATGGGEIAAIMRY